MAIGTVAVKIELGGVVVVDQTNAFNFTEPPPPPPVKSITISPTSGPSGTTVTITPHNFTFAPETQVFFGGVLAQHIHVAVDGLSLTCVAVSA